MSVFTTVSPSSDESCTEQGFEIERKPSVEYTLFPIEVYDDMTHDLNFNHFSS